MTRKYIVQLTASLLLMAIPAVPLVAQPSSVSVEQVPCLPLDANAVVQAQVEDLAPGNEVRLYFRRLHETVEDFYWVEMEPSGDGFYWATFPQPEAEILEPFELEERFRTRDEHDDYPLGAWWQVKEESDHRNPNRDLDTEEIVERASIGRLERRDWLRNMSLAELQEWLSRQRYEPSEYLVAVVEPDGSVVDHSVMRVTEVTADCEVTLTPQEGGYASNLTIGETAGWQQNGEGPFHWQCDGVVSRVNPAGILRGDEACRACVIAWWQKQGFLIPAATVGSIGTGGVVFDDEPEPSPSPSEP